jgi:NTE family protein
VTKETAAGQPVLVDYLLIGGGVAAASTAETLRNEGEQGTIVMLCAESCYPYDRPPLTGSILTGEITPDQALIRPPSAYKHDAVDVRLNSAVRAVLPRRHLAVDQNGIAYRYGKLLITTGAEPRRLDVKGKELAGILTLHTMADALTLRAAVLRQDRVVIVGSSFIAMETATTLSRLGLHVCIVDAAATVFPKIESPLLSQFFLDRCTQHALEVHLNERIIGFTGDDKVSGVLTASGKHLACDTVILAVGVTPQISFLRDSGIQTGEGLLVGEYLRTSDPDIFAAGDVASYLASDGQRHLAEHWDNAIRQGRVAARNMLGQQIPYDDVQHYFCDFLDVSFTFLGTSESADARILRGDIEAGSFAEFYVRENRIIGLFSAGRPPDETRVVETLIRQGTDVRKSLPILSDLEADLGILARETVLILQGGGALGAFECGVVRAMEEDGRFPKIIGGISVGALNGAIIAANPGGAYRTLDAFWNDLSVYVVANGTPFLASAFAAWNTMAYGIPGFFQPRWLSPLIEGEEFPLQWTSLYDAAPLGMLLEKYIDFERLASSPIRLIVGAVDVELGELTFFDSKADRLTPAHILASCSLPPAFRWTTIDGRHYWDGGIVSNSPLEHVLSVTGTDNKDVVIVDLFPGRRQLPTNLAEVVARRDEITYGERIRNDSRLRELLQDYQALIADIMLSVGPETVRRVKQRPRYIHLMERGATTSVLRIVRESHGKLPPALDYDFSSETIERHKQEGYRIAKKLLSSGLIFAAGHADRKLKVAGVDDPVQPPLQTHGTVKSRAQEENSK